MRVCCHPHLGFPPHGSDLPTEIPGQRLNFGTHFRFLSRKKTKRNVFSWGKCQRKIDGSSWDQLGQELGWVTRCKFETKISQSASWFFLNYELFQNFQKSQDFDFFFLSCCEMRDFSDRDLTTNLEHLFGRVPTGLI